ncbi:pullulanase-associated domain-containing protein [Streptococcus lutetiensis]|uniref:pullulanase-associated domain-containing protein n=1 Tax=Streptococcus lutetiensis TaxID=150055 RepID=UPI003D6B2D0A
MKKVSRLSFPEKREYFGIRKLKVGIASVAIATALFWGAGLTSVSANQATSQAAVSEVINETSLPDDGSQALLEPEKTADANQNLEESNSSDLSDDSQNQLTESESSAVEETVPESQPQEVISQAQGVQGAAEIDEISDVKAVTSAENSNQVNLLKSSQSDNQVSNPPIAENTLRVHFKTLPSDDLASLGLWTWEDVEHPSESWPNGAINLSNLKHDAYGYYIDVKLVNGNPHKVGLLINNTSGENVSGDKVVNLISQDMNEVWFDEDYNAIYYAPLEKGKIRINYYRSDGNYKNLAIWLWGSADSSITSRLGS